MTRRLPLAAFACALVLVALAAGCRSPTKEAEHDARARAREASLDITPAPYTIQPGDVVLVKFPLYADYDSQLPVRPDGKFSLPLIGEVEAAGNTPEALQSTLRTTYEDYLRHPDLTVNVVTFGSNVAYVGGEVRNPRMIDLGIHTSALRAIIAAGGSLDTGQMRKVVIVRDQGTPEPQILMLDLSRGLETLASAEDVWLKPRDMVFVPRTGISKANQFVREYIRDMLPIQSSFSLQYQFTKVQNGF